MASERESTCPGCGLRMPLIPGKVYGGYYTTSPECWDLYTEVLAREYQNAVLFGRVHQTTVDSYAVHHAGGVHKDKSVVVHLAGLHLVLERGVPPPAVPRLLQRLVGAVDAWPHFDPPDLQGAPTVLDVAMAPTPAEHAERVRAWSGALWKAWEPRHAEVAALVERHLAAQLA